MGQLLIIVGGIFFIGAFVGPIAEYLNDRERRNGKGRSIILYAVGVLLAGALACVLFVPAFFVMCSGEACAWIATIVALPAFFALGVATFVYFWVRRGNTPTLRSSAPAQKRAP